MSDLARLFENNRAWAAATVARDPQFFADLPPLPKTLAECKGKLG